MNSFYRATQIIKDILQSNLDVNTVIFGKSNEKDLYKKNVYPLAHINPAPRDFSSSQQNVYSFEIIVLDQRDISQSMDVDKFEGNDNQIDNLNTCDAVLNDLISRLRLQDNDGLELISVTQALPQLYTDYNLLDGWGIIITVALPNTVISACD